MARAVTWYANRSHQPQTPSAAASGKIFADLALSGRARLCTSVKEFLREPPNSSFGSFARSSEQPVRGAGTPLEMERPEPHGVLFGTPCSSLKRALGLSMCSVRIRSTGDRERRSSASDVACSSNASRPPELLKISYVLAQDGIAAIIDPKRDIDRYLNVLRENGLRLRWVLETHRQEDFEMGGAELRRLTGTQIGCLRS